VQLLTSVEAGQWKVQTGKLAKQTNSNGFLAKLLDALSLDALSPARKITFLSQAPADLRMAQQLSETTTVMQGDKYFNDTSTLQRYAMNAYENWPILAIFLVAVTLLVAFLCAR